MIQVHVSIIVPDVMAPGEFEQLMHVLREIDDAYECDRDHPFLELTTSLEVVDMKGITRVDSHKNLKADEEKGEDAS